MPTSFTRRGMMRAAGVLAAGSFLGSGRSARADARAKVESVDIISQQPGHYHGWPTLARRKNGELIVVCSGGREEHVCPFGQVEMMRSRDNGAQWDWPRVLLDSGIDDRDAGVVETQAGSLLVTTFTSLAYEERLAKMRNELQSAPPDNANLAARYRRWAAAHARLSADERKRDLGTWVIRSDDGGLTWSTRLECPVNSPHGPFVLSDGRILYAGKELWRSTERIGVCESRDDGRTWTWLAAIPTRPGDRLDEYHELHGVQAADGSIVVQIRNHNPMNNGESLQTESTDGGRTWSIPHSIGVWGHPSHLLRLHDGRLLMSYGHRRTPIGNQARLSSDNGRTWSRPLIIQGDAASGDLGYPSTVELASGELLTVWYERMRQSPLAVLRQARWKIV